MPDTHYWASSTPRKRDGIPVGRADAEYLSREEGCYIFAVTR